MQTLHAINSWLTYSNESIYNTGTVEILKRNWHIDTKTQKSLVIYNTNPENWLEIENWTKKEFSKVDYLNQLPYRIKR